jgi:hypothetical protein
MVNNTFHPHVWFKNSNDVFRHNIVSTGYKPVNIDVWGKEVDYNAFSDSVSLKAAWKRGTDKHSVCCKPDFVNPQAGNFRLKEGSMALSVGFKNFAMDSFGVVSPKLKALAKKVTIPSVLALDKVDDDEIIDFMGAKVKNITTLGERSATGMYDTRGVLVMEVAAGSVASRFLQTNDVILSINSRKINNMRDLLEARKSVDGAKAEVVVFRNQKEVRLITK